MHINLTGKNALITGGTRGIGRAISLTLAQAGARVCAVYRSNETHADRTLRDLRGLPNTPDHFTLQADISEENSAINVVQSAAERFGGAIDLIVLDAAAGAGGPLVGMTTDEWKKPFEVNVHGAFYIVRAAARLCAPRQAWFCCLRARDTTTLKTCPHMGQAKRP